jgi:hypothetical protein
MSIIKLSLRGNVVLLFPPRESLVGDIPVGDGKKYNLFYSVDDMYSTLTGQF